MGTIHGLLTQINDWLISACKLICIVLTAGMVLVVFGQFVTREFTSSALVWTDEVSRHAFAWAMLLAAAILVHEKEHIVVDLLTTKLTGLARRVVDVAADLVAGSFFVVMIYFGTQQVESNWQHESPVLGIPMSLVYLVIPISGTIMLLSMVEILWGHLSAAPGGER